MKECIFVRRLLMVVLFVIVPMMWCSATLAQDEQPLYTPDAEAVYEEVYDDGEVVIVATPCPEGVDLAKSVDTSKTAKVIVYAAYTSDRGSNNEDLYTLPNGRGGDTYWPWLCPDQVYLYMAFSVSQPCFAKLTWMVTALSKPNLKRKYSVTPPILFTPNFWYYAYLHPHNFLYWAYLQHPHIGLGQYRLHAKAKPTLRRSKGDWDLCKFWVLPICYLKGAE